MDGYKTSTIEDININQFEERNANTFQEYVDLFREVYRRNIGVVKNWNAFDKYVTIF